MDEKSIEHERLGRHIEQQFRLIVQVFTTSLVAAVALLGYGLSYIGRATDPSPTGLLVLLAPLVVVLPSAYLIKGLRQEIFQWGAFIRIYIDPGAQFRYETEVAEYRSRFQKDNSFDAITWTYSALCFLCCVIYAYQVYDMSASPWLHVATAPFLAALVHWCARYVRLPARADQMYEERWREIRRTEDVHKNNDAL